mgnify:CR=1 FL=1|jgi:hypothetical protein
MSDGTKNKLGRVLKKTVTQYFENLEHRREFEKWHLSKYGTEYQWKGGNKKAANDAATP